MKRSPVRLHVSDHAILRYLEREHGLNVEAVRQHLTDAARPAAEVGAIALQIERVKLLFERAAQSVTVVTVVPRRSTSPRRNGE